MTAPDKKTPGRPGVDGAPMAGRDGPGPVGEGAVGRPPAPARAASLGPDRPAEPDPTPPRSAREVFVAFSLLALQGFGGVMAVTQRELVERRRWLTRQQFLEDWAVAQILPGPNIANMAILLGDRYVGAKGALAALTGLFGVPLLILLAMVLAFGAVGDVPAVQGALRGMGVVAAALILNTAVKLLPALAGHPGGRAFCGLSMATTLLALVAFGLPLGGVLLVIGGLSCLWTWHRLGARAGVTGGRP